SLCVNNLQDKDGRAVFRNINLDMVNYGKLQMFIHAEENGGATVNDGDVTGFIRLGTDFDVNFYEVEVPLKITRPSAGTDPTLIWPEENEIEIAFDILGEVKKRRDRANFPLEIPYTETVGKYVITVRGRPNIAEVT